MLSYKQNSFGCFFEKNEVQNFSKNTQHFFAYISATKYRSEAVLYSKRTAGYPLSPRIKTIAVAFLQAEVIRARPLGGGEGKQVVYTKMTEEERGSGQRW